MICLNSGGGRHQGGDKADNEADNISHYIEALLYTLLCCPTLALAGDKHYPSVLQIQLQVTHLVQSET